MKKIIFILAGSMFLVVLLLAYSFLFLDGSYLVTNYQHKRLRAAEPENRNEVENVLYWYTSKNLKEEDFSKPMEYWESSDSAAKQLYWIRYNIMGRGPIDIAYDNEDKVVAIFDTYE